MALRFGWSSPSVSPVVQEGADLPLIWGTAILPALAAVVVVLGPLCLCHICFSFARLVCSCADLLPPHRLLHQGEIHPYFFDLRSIELMFALVLLKYLQISSDLWSMCVDLCMSCANLFLTSQQESPYLLFICIYNMCVCEKGYLQKYTSYRAQRAKRIIARKTMWSSLSTNLGNLFLSSAWP